MNIVNNYMKYLYDRKITKSSISRKLSSIRGLYNYLVREDIIKENHFNKIQNPKRELYLPKFLKDEELDKIFTAYYRSNEHKETQGDGLGLYIVSTNMVLLGGSASAYINENKGLTVKLEIPLKHC